MRTERCVAVHVRRNGKSAIERCGMQSRVRWGNLCLGALPGQICDVDLVGPASAVCRRMGRNHADVTLDNHDARINLIENFIERIARKIRVLDVDVLVIVAVSASGPAARAVLIPGVSAREDHPRVPDVGQDASCLERDAEVIMIRFRCRNRRAENLPQRPVSLPHLDRRFHVRGKPVITDRRIVGIREKNFDDIEIPDAVSGRERLRRVRLL